MITYYNSKNINLLVNIGFIVSIMIVMETILFYHNITDFDYKLFGDFNTYKVDKKILIILTETTPV